MTTTIAPPAPPTASGSPDGAAASPVPPTTPSTAAPKMAALLGKAVRIFARIIVSILLVLVFAGPFYWMVLTAFQTASEALSIPPQFWVDAVRWDNFIAAFDRVNFGHFALNSVIVTGGTLLGQFLIIVPAAYAFARFQFKGRDVLFGVVLATMMIPGQLIFLPVFAMYAKMGLLNTHLSLILPFIASGFGIFLLRQTFMRVPDSLIEAARLDHASEFTIIRRIMLPLAKPTIVTIGLITFIGTWNNYFFPLVWTTTDAARTLPVAVPRLEALDEIAPTIVMAGNMLLVVPILIVFLLARRHIISAFTYTGVK
ncbi:MAG: ABC transporter permease subunit [Salinibacterium amurskyense]